ncbi:hypothetical protein GY45DRAFT_1341105 [Cubamyces sp. BRFM 1775]|nr:hypothetical protein GY45DRAFT_1341105 [Cubamyces sp. BRFM 1775]
MFLLTLASDCASILLYYHYYHTSSIRPPQYGLSSPQSVQERLVCIMIPDLLEGPQESWLQHYTSNCISNGDVDQIISALENEGLVLDHKDALEWRDFPVKPSVLHEQKKDDSMGAHCAGRGKTEREIFRPLCTIINAIAKVPLPSLTASCEYDEEPYSMDPVLSESQHRIDGALRLIKSNSSPAPRCSRARMLDIAVNFAFKCGDKPEDIYNVLQDVRAIVRTLAALIFSTAEDLGYDTNVRRILEWDEEIKEDNIRYVYRLDDRFFKTSNCRDEYSDPYIAGWAIRVWEVVEVASFDDPAALPNVQWMILRDVWLDHDSNTEGEIQEKIFKRCDELGRYFPPENDARLRDINDATRTLLCQRLEDGSYKELFLTINADYRGATSKPCAEGFMPAPDVFVEPMYINQEAKSYVSDPQRASTSRNRADLNLTIPSKQQAGAPREYKPKQHSFIVYEEVCSALHELDDLYDVVQALLDAVLGNILFFKGRGKLCDLEYAKEFDLSGTPIFMAVELQCNSSIYKDLGFSEDMQDDETRESPPRPSLTIRHNFQHDLESIFWILAWLVFTHIPGQNCAYAAAELFHSKHPRFLIGRLHFLTNSDFCLVQLRTLSSDLPPVLAEASLVRPALTSVGVKSGHPPRTDDLRQKMDGPKDNSVSPHKADTFKRPRGTSDDGEVDGCLHVRECMCSGG